MTGILTCVATVLLGVEAGWKPLDGGGMEYTLQIEPGMLEALNRGESWDSYVKPEVRDIRVFRVVVGQGKLPQVSTAPAAPAPTLSGPALGPPETPASPNPFRTAKPPLTETTRWPSTFAGNGEKSSVAPATLPPSTEGKPLPAAQASYEQPADAPKSETKSQSPESTPSTQPAKPWPLLWGAVLALAASLSGNAYLGWIYYEARNRCRAMLGRTRNAAMGQAGTAP
jgi:hypothetical protein